MFWCAIPYIEEGWFDSPSFKFLASHICILRFVYKITPLWSFNFLNYRVRQWPGRQRITERRPRSRPGCEILNSLFLKLSQPLTQAQISNMSSYRHVFIIDIIDIFTCITQTFNILQLTIALLFRKFWKHHTHLPLCMKNEAHYYA